MYKRQRLIARPIPWTEKHHKPVYDIFVKILAGFNVFYMWVLKFDNYMINLLSNPTEVFSFAFPSCQVCLRDE